MIRAPCRAFGKTVVYTLDYEHQYAGPLCAKSGHFGNRGGGVILRLRSEDAVTSRR